MTISGKRIDEKAALIQVTAMPTFTLHSNTVKRVIIWSKITCVSLCLWSTGCETTDVLNAASKIPYINGLVPPEASQIIEAISAIAAYQASQSQIAQARERAKTTSGSGRKYIRVDPEPGKGEGTHVVEYNPATGNVGKVKVIKQSVGRGETIKIDGKAGKVV